MQHRQGKRALQVLPFKKELCASSILRSMPYFVYSLSLFWRDYTKIYGKEITFWQRVWRNLSMFGLHEISFTLLIEDRPGKIDDIASFSTYEARRHLHQYDQRCQKLCSTKRFMWLGVVIPWLLWVWASRAFILLYMLVFVKAVSPSFFLLPSPSSMTIRRPLQSWRPPQDHHIYHPHSFVDVFSCTNCMFL